MENEEVKVTETQEQPQITAEDYLNNLSALKNSTVSKEEYARLMEENRKLADALANGLPYDKKDDSEEPKADIDALRQNLFVNHKYRSDLDFFTDLLTLRKALMDEGGVDPFLPTNPEYIPNDADSERAQYIADEIQDAIDYADGDAEVFRVDLQRRCGVKSNNKR